MPRRVSPSLRAVLNAAAVVVLTACTASEPPRSPRSRAAAPPPGACPEPRATERAPDSYVHRKNWQLVMYLRTFATP